ncbi:MAG: Na(+)-translocating NADH-quinone reductase subunit C, partial [Kiritimatiellaceae bacterium]|nr:Na(+)-translocating NADH-quinone reductase subunit C [Kiritimatiellaceae bacterium]
MREESKTIVFALGVCLICSILLSGLAAGLKSIQTANQEFDVKRNIVKAFGIDISTLTRDQIE